MHMPVFVVQCDESTGKKFSSLKMPFHFTFQCRHEQLHGDSDKIRPRPMGEYVLVLHRLPAGLQWREQSRERRRRWAFQGQ